MGQSRLTADQLVAYYQRRAAGSRTAPPAPPCSSSRRCTSREGNRYNVRGDIAFAQSIVETAWFNYPDYGTGPPVQQQLRRHRRVRLVRQRLPVQQRARTVCARSCSCSATTPTAPRGSPARSPIHRCPSCGAAPRRPRRTTSTTTSPRARRRSGTTWATATGRPRRTTPPSCSSVYNQMLTDSGEAGQCPPDGLLFGAAHRGRALPGEPAPTRAGHRHRRRGGGTYVLNGNGAVTAYNGAPVLRVAAARPTPTAFRDIAAMPDGQGYVVLDEYGLVYKFGSATVAAAPSGRSSMGFYLGAGRRPLDRGDARRQGLPDPARRRQHPEVRVAPPPAPSAWLGHPAWLGADDGRCDRGHARRRGLRRARQVRRRRQVRQRATTARSAPGSTPYWGIDIGRDVAIVSGVRHRVRLLRARRAGAASPPPVGSPAARTRARRCSATAGAGSRSTAAGRCWCATTAPPS